MSTNNTTRNGRLTADQNMIDGVKKFLQQFASLPVGSQSMTPAEIVKVFQDRVDSSKAVVTADAARTAAVKADQDKRAQTAAFAQSLRRMVQGMFSQSPDTLATFGLTPLKVVKKSVATKATAVAKSEATRKARSTMGTKQKAKIKGTVPTPATSGTVPAPAIPPAKPTA